MDVLRIGVGLGHEGWPVSRVAGAGKPAATLVVFPNSFRNRRGNRVHHL